MSPEPTTTDDAEGIDGTVTAYRERVHAPWPIWVLVLALTASLGVAYGARLGALVGVVTFAVAQGLVTWWLVATAPLVAVDDRVFRAGRARLPLRHVGRIAPLDAAQSRDARGRLADPAAYLCLRSWTSCTVLVEVEDPEDPHPYWLVSTRRGHDLALALAAARDSALGSSGGPSSG